MLKEFKAFIMKGNVLELAVAVIMATYFGNIVKSLTNDVIMPPIGQVIGGVDFNELKIVLQDEVAPSMEGDTEIAGTPEVAIYWGKFINEVITFIIVAFVIFMIIRTYNRMKKKEEEAPAPDPGPSEIDLLKEIRDSLKK